MILSILLGYLATIALYNQPVSGMIHIISMFKFMHDNCVWYNYLVNGNIFEREQEVITGVVTCTNNNDCDTGFSCQKDPRCIVWSATTSCPGEPNICVDINWLCIPSLGYPCRDKDYRCIVDPNNGGTGLCVRYQCIPGWC